MIYTPHQLREIPMFFIVGMGRSGTTLLKTLFDNHPNAISTPESKIILALRHGFYGKKLVPAHTDHIIEHIRLDRKIMNNWGIDIDKLRQNLTELIALGARFEDVCKCIYLHHPVAAEKEHIMLIGDKNPGYSMNVEWLQKTFPQARFVHIIRDYRDCISSHNRVFKRRHVSLLANSWVQYNRNIERIKARFPQQFATVRYEDLSTEPDKEIHRLCGFLGIGFNPSMLNYSERYKTEKKSGNMNYKVFEKTHGDLLKPIHDKNIGKYKKYMSNYQVRLAEYACNKKGLEYGYTATQPKVPTFNLWFPLITFLCRLRFYLTNIIIALYYTLPLWARKTIRKYSNFMHRTFRHTNRYNNAELMYQKEE